MTNIIPMVSFLRQDDDFRLEIVTELYEKLLFAEIPHHETKQRMRTSLRLNHSNDVFCDELSRLQIAE